jgi:DeoR/GlpR family transcriptional regulator of sugar metabolism
MLAQPRSQEPLYTTRAVSMLAEKEAIAETTANLIHDGESIFLDLGTTTMEVAKRLCNHRSLTVITNSLMIAQIMADLPDITIYLTGGQLRPGEHSLSGSWAQQSLQNIYVDKAIVGAGGLTVETGLTDFHMEEAAIRRMMIQQSNRTVVATDSTKFGVTALVGVVPIQQIHTLVTDSDIEPDWLEAFQSIGLEVITAPLKDSLVDPTIA